jgi:tetratricopeptide (TPR) repeat protein
MAAPKVFISYSHDSPEHKDRVLALSNRLREEGVDCSIDQYKQSPEEGWPLWCERQVLQSNFVLVACTETYLRRFQGKEVPRKKLGGTWEGHIITQELYNVQGKNTKFIPITFRPEEAAFIPPPLRSATAYQLYGDYEPLYRRLTAQPLITKPAFGSIIPQAPRVPPVLEHKQGLEPLWHVRHRRNSFFTGREKVLSELGRALEKERPVALVGLGGVGKTQTATEYAYRSRNLYRAVFWANAESRETLLADFVSVAGVLELPSAQAKDLELAGMDVKRWLESNPGWLLILDNADELPLIREFFPHSGKGHLLLTTRDRAAAALAECIPMQDMTPEEGAWLLLRRAGVIARDAPFNDAGEADRLLARQLSKELGGLPLALDQAVAFIEETHRSLAEYAGLYASEKADLLAERGSLGEHPSVTVTFSLAFEKVASNNAAAADLIRLCAFLAPEAIPEEIFREGASVLGENLGYAAANELSFARITGEARRFSLLDRDAAAKTLEIHRLAQIVIKATMPANDQRSWAERAIRATEKAFPSVEYSNWPLCQKLIVHAQACASLLAEWDFGFAEGASLLNRAAIYLTARALFTEAEPLYQYSLAIREKTLGKDHPDVATSLNNLADLYRDQGKYAEAEPLYQRSLAIREKVQGAGHPDVATSLNNLAGLYDNQGKYGEAEALYQRSLAIREKALGPAHPDVATSLNNLAELYRNQGKYGEAETLYRRALKIFERTLGPDHPQLAVVLNNLGGLLYSQGFYREIEPLFRRSLTISEKVLGARHPDVADGLNNLAELFRNQGNYGEAEPLYRRALEILEGSLGPAHPKVVATLTNLARLYDSQGNYNRADQFYKRARLLSETFPFPGQSNTSALPGEEIAVVRRLLLEAGARGSDHQGRTIVAEFETGPLRSFGPIPVLVSVAPLNESDVQNLAERASSLSRQANECVGVTFYAEPPETIVRVAIAAARFRRRCSILPIPLSAAPEAAATKEKAVALFQSYADRYLGNTDFFADTKALGDTMLFFGRENLLQRLVEQDLQRCQGIGLFGMRKSGKTSLLLQLGLALRKNPVVHSSCPCTLPSAAAAPVAARNPRRVVFTRHPR